MSYDTSNKQMGEGNKQVVHVKFKPVDSRPR